MWALVALALRVHWLFALVIAWSGLSLLVMVGLYLWASYGANPGGLLRGSRAPWLQPLFLPFRGVSLALHVLSRATGRAEAACEVAPGVFVGPRPRAGEVPSLASQGVLSVIDLASELPVQKAFLRDPFARYDLSLLDRTAPTDAALDGAVRWGLAELSRGRKVLVHCSFGRGRSALVACALALAAGDRAEPVQSLLARVRSRRRSVSIKSDQLAALERFSVRLRSREGGWVE